MPRTTARFAATLAAIVLSAVAAPVCAHPGHDLPGAGFIAGFVHPWLGFDHLLAMIAVGIWAAQLGGHARLLVPAAFVSVMGLGAAGALAGFVPSHIEAGIAASLFVLGLFVAAAGRLPVAAAMVLSASFAFCHGAAHGSELPAFADPLRFGTGFVLATALLHGSGLGIGYAAQRRGQWLARAAGMLTMAGGLAYAFA